MAKFPEHYYAQFEEFMVDYAHHHHQAIKSLNVDAVNQAQKLIHERIKNHQTIFVCGNGGSAAIANHLTCDFAKGIPTGAHIPAYIRPKIASLCHLELITAYGNDNGYDEVFWRQLEQASRPGDLLIAMSVSGHSPNILEAARRFSPVIGITGLGGGQLAYLSDVHIQVDDPHNYGIAEDVFQTIMHIISQFIRQANMMPEMIRETKF